MKAEREAAKKAAIERTAIVEAAEVVAAQDPATRSKNSRTELTNLFDQWKYAQRHSARIDVPLRKHCGSGSPLPARPSDRHRRQFFSQKDMSKEVIARKEAIIARAEAIADSTDWGSTSASSVLMNDWKMPA